MELLEQAGYESVDFMKDTDKVLWKTRQQNLIDVTNNQKYYTGPIDGIPGPGMVKALKAAGYKHGLWISRPGD